MLAEIDAAAADGVETGLRMPSQNEIDEAVREYRDSLRPGVAISGPRDTHVTRSEQIGSMIALVAEQASYGAVGTMALQTRWLCDDRGWNVPDNSAPFRDISAKLLRARLDWLREEDHKAKALYTTRDNADPMFDSTLSGGQVGSDKTVGELIALYRKMHEPELAASTVKNYRIALRALEEVLGADFPLKKRNRERCRGVRDLLIGLPSNYSKLPLTRGLSLRDAVEVGREHSLPTVMPATLNGYVTKLSAILKLAVTEEWIPSNPATDLKVKDPVSPRKKRNPFAVVQLTKLFSAEPWESNDRQPKGRPARFWLPLLALYTGARVGELAQLRVIDVVTRYNIVCIDISATETTQIKNQNSERIIPVHSELVRLGFLEFVQAARDNGQDRLFPQELRDGLGHYGRGVSDWFARLLTTLGMTDKKLTFHSFRHNFEDALREADLHGTPLGAYITGRASGGTEKIYGEGYDASTKKIRGAVERVRYPGLDLSALYID